MSIKLKHFRAPVSDQEGGMCAQQEDDLSWDGLDPEEDADPEMIAAELV